MYFSNAYKARPALFRVVALVLVSCAFAGCKKDQGAAAPDAAAGAAATQAAQPAVADKVNAMSADQLRDESERLATYATVSAAVGGGLLLTGLVVYFTAPSEPSRERLALGVSPDGRGGLAFQAAGSF